MDEREFEAELQQAEEGSAVHQAFLGARLLYQIDVPVRDHALAVRLLTMAHAQGVLVAAVALSDAYLGGIGVPADPPRAAELLRGAAARGHWPSLLELARLHRDGHVGVPADAAQAAAWFDRALATADEAGFEDSDMAEEARAERARLG